MPDFMKIPLSGAGSILEWESCGGSGREPWATGAEESRKETLSAHMLVHMEYGGRMHIWRFAGGIWRSKGQSHG